jgi:hypothetical protein
MSKYYDKGILNSIYNDLPYNKTHLNNNYKIPNKKINNERNSNTIGEQDDQIDFTDLKDSHITDTIESSQYENLDNKFTKIMRAQLNYNDDDSISPKVLCARQTRWSN